MNPRRIAIGGVHIESGVFSPLRSGLDDFRIARGEAVLESFAFLREREFFARRSDAYEWIGLLDAWALPGGMVRRATYDALRSELLQRLEAALPLDGFYYDIHGAMAVEGLDDAEADLLADIRVRTGDACLISTAMDLHGNVSARLVQLSDMLTTYRTAPHVDAAQTREKAARMLVECLEGNVRPRRAFVRVPIILPGERTSTLVEPCKTLYRRLGESDAVAGVIDASMWIGYVWADEPRVQGGVVVTGIDRTTISSEARRIAQRYWDARGALGFTVPAGDADWCIDQALAWRERQAGTPVVISDSGDNPTAGGAGDVPYFVEHLLGHAGFASSGASAIYASLPDAAAIERCFMSGLGTRVACTLGGKLDPVHGRPLGVSGDIVHLSDGDPVARRQAVLRCGRVSIIVTERRKPFHRLDDFRRLGLDPDAHDLVVVKIGYLEPELGALARGAFLALTPGAVNQDIPSLPFTRVLRPLYPLDPEMVWSPDVIVL
jgi:microcystin degradation protein MlrC